MKDVTEKASKKRGWYWPLHVSFAVVALLLPGTSAGQTLDKLAKTLQITGHVVDITEGPLRETVVTLTVPGSEKPTSTAITDRRGDFIFNSVAPQAYDLRLYEKGFKPVTMRLEESAMDVDLIHVGTVVLDIGEVTEGPMAVPAGRSRRKQSNRPVREPMGLAVRYRPKPRQITFEEATALVYAYLKGCNKKHCPLEEYHNPDASDFYGFQALNADPGKPANLGFFEVDPQAGDLWSGVVCQQFTSPPLLRLQRTTRQRIGLTDEEYRKARRPGPFCEPDEKPLIAN